MSRVRPISSCLSIVFALLCLTACQGDTRGSGSTPPRESTGASSLPDPPVGSAKPVSSAPSSSDPSAAPASACSSPEHHQFDFWLGEWSVTQKGEPAGNNRIDSVSSGCALFEQWSSVRSGFTGRSLSFYDGARGVWHQTWIGGDGQPLYLEGDWDGTAMTLESPATATGGRQRVRFTPNADGSVRQLWESTADGKSWKVEFDGEYRKTTKIPM